MLLDGQMGAPLGYIRGQSRTFENLPEEHSVRLTTDVSGAAKAAYPFISEPATMLLLASGLVGLWGVGRKLKT